MLRLSYKSSTSIEKLLGTHAVKAWTSIDNALQDHCVTTKTNFAVNKKKIVPVILKLLQTFGPSIPKNMSRHIFDEILVSLDDIAYYLANQSTLMVFTDERKYGETPTTPRSIPPAEHLFNTILSFQATAIKSKNEWVNNVASLKMKKKYYSKKNTKRMNLLTSYIQKMTDRIFIKWLCNSYTRTVSIYRSEICGHLKCCLLEMGASADPGSHTIRGGLCCRVKGCRRSAVRQSFCVGHALEELTNMERIPNAKTFLTNPIHRSCLLNWFIDRGDKKSITQLKFCYQMNLFKECCSCKIKQLRCISIFDKYSKFSKQKNRNNSGNLRPAIDFEELCKIKIRDIVALNEKRDISAICSMKERVLLEAHEKILLTLTRKLNSVFFRSRCFLEHLEKLRDQLSSPRNGRSCRFEWRLPCDTSKTVFDGVRLGTAVVNENSCAAKTWSLKINTVVNHTFNDNDDGINSEIKTGSDTSYFTGTSVRSSGGSLSTEGSSILSDGSINLSLDFSSIRK